MKFPRETIFIRDVCLGIKPFAFAGSNPLAKGDWIKTRRADAN